MLSEDDPNTHISKSRLACIYKSLGKFTQAREYGESAVVGLRRTLREGHYETIGAMTTLAVVYYSQQEYHDATILEDYMFQLAIKIFGISHSMTLSVLNSLVISCILSYKFKDLTKLSLELSRRAIKVWNQGHPSTLTFLANLKATCLDKLILPEVSSLKIDQGRDRILSLLNLAKNYIIQDGKGKAVELLDGLISGHNTYEIILLLFQDYYFEGSIEEILFTL